MPHTIKIAAVQMIARPASLSERLARAETLVVHAAQGGAQLVVLPELFNTGYEYCDENCRRAEALDGPTSTWMKQTANRYSVHIAGTFLRLDSQDIYNTLLLVAPDGRAWRYDKNSNRKIPPTRLLQGKMQSCINLAPERCVGETSQRQSPSAQTLLPSRANDLPSLWSNLETLLSVVAEVHCFLGWALLGCQLGL